MHIDTDLSLRAIRNFQRSGSKYLVVPHWPFFDGSSNEYHPADFELAYHNVHDLNPKASQVIGYHHYNLELPPYCFPAPLYWIRNSAIAERNGWLGVWALPALGRGQHSKCLARTAWFDTICDSRFNCFDTQEERRDCLAGNSRSGSPCCTALHLIQRLHSLDTGAMWFVEPQQVQSLCSDFVRLPTGSLLLEEQMTVCSRAVLALAEFAYETHTGNATHETRNESCSTVSVHARYPLLAEEDKVLSEQLQKQRLQWWDRAYRIHTHLGSSWSYQLNGRKLLMSLANHTAACDKLEQGCALFNPWEPQRCFPHHPLIRAWSPSCRKRPQIPRRPLRASPGPVRDWLGLRQDCGHSESEESSPVPQIRPHVSVTRALECAGLPWGPVAGEDYFETISFLSAVEDAPADTFNVIEVAGSLFWALKAAKAFKRRSSGGACKLIFFPTLPATSRELHHDGRRKLCNTTVYRSQINSGLLDSTLAAGHVDFLHADIFEGIGRAIALAYAKESSNLILAARTKVDLDEVATECSKVGKVRTFPVDLSNREGVDSLASFVDSFGGCDVLVNNAGRVSPGSASEGDVDDWDKMIYLNLNGVMRLTRRLIPNMAAKKWGALINLGSIAAIEGMSGSQAAYAATKHGLRGWNHSIYQGLRHDNIKVMLINPAFVNTPLVTGMGNENRSPTGDRSPGTARGFGAAGSNQVSVLSEVNTTLASRVPLDRLRASAIRSKMLSCIRFESLLNTDGDPDCPWPTQDPYRRYGAENFAKDGAIIWFEPLPPMLPILDCNPKLPPSKMPDAYSLVLDLDETLVHYSEHDGMGSYEIRPGMHEFVQRMHANGYELIIFTAATQ
ncbi:unnamed protein product, partial [Symbiodinium sp. KB8]